jgi:hypothetical protein
MGGGEKETLAQDRIEEAENYGFALSAMAHQCNELKVCDMIPMEVREFVGVASVEEVCKNFSLRVIRYKVMLLKENGFAANDMLFNINGFYVGRLDEGLKVRFSVYLGFPHDEILEAFGKEQTHEAFALLYGEPIASTMLQAASAMLQSDGRTTSTMLQSPSAMLQANESGNGSLITPSTRSSVSVMQKMLESMSVEARAKVFKYLLESMSKEARAEVFKYLLQEASPTSP